MCSDLLGSWFNSCTCWWGFGNIFNSNFFFYVSRLEPSKFLFLLLLDKVRSSLHYMILFANRSTQMMLLDNKWYGIWRYGCKKKLFCNVWFLDFIWFFSDYPYIGNVWSQKWNFFSHLIMYIQTDIRALHFMSPMQWTHLFL